MVSISRLEQLRVELGGAVLRDLIDSALADLAEALDRLDGLIAAGDAPGARILAHGLAGLAASYALPALDSALRGAAEATDAGDLGTAAGAAALARRLYADSAPALRAAAGAPP